MIAGKSSNPYLAFKNKLNNQEAVKKPSPNDGPEVLASSNPFVETAEDDLQPKLKKTK